MSTLHDTPSGPVTVRQLGPVRFAFGHPRAIRAWVRENRGRK